jgi:hypothetical protein
MFPVTQTLVCIGAAGGRPVARVCRASARLLLSIAALGRGILALLREIGDENAYHRYLTTRDLQPSRENWRAFSEQRMVARYRKPKCC